MLNNRRDAISGVFSTFRVSAWSVRRKVVAVLALPVILAVVFGGLRVSSELTSASDYSTNQQRSTVLGPAITYLAATERLALPPSLADRMGGDGHGDANQAYADALAALKGAASTANLSSGQAAVVGQLTQIGDTLHNGSGTGITATPPAQLSDMASLTDSLIGSTLNTKGTPDPRVQGLVQAVNGRLSLVKQQLIIEDNSSQLGAVWLPAEIGVEGAALDSLKASAGRQGGRQVAALASANTTRLGEAATSKIAELAATPSMFVEYDRVSSRLLTRISGLVADRASAAKSRALTDAGIILLALLASVLLALVVARALINPLRRVRAGALDVAHVKLPETVERIRRGEEPDALVPIDVHTEEELGQLARAVDDMHRQAVSLATGEAQLRTQVGAMFVTLSRRNTTLVNQQLALIESLEQDEEDPQRLEQLFSLDHLATRMRRTAESLVILGGTTGRTASFEELSVSDVIHAAVSEVQDYQRVRIDAAPDRLIMGRAASDVVHLMAELIDNALSYSPPGSPVTIQAAEDNGRVEIEIIDSGLGMAGDALALANDSLKSGGEVTIDTARRMGLFVVSRLAEEHGLKVKLRRNANGGGIIASILLPADVLVGDGPVEHVSLMDAPESVEEPEVLVVAEPEEEYDPYLERIEEAIAAVTGLPRRRPGVGGPDPEPVATPAAAAAVSMFEAPPAVAPAYEPVALPSATDESSRERRVRRARGAVQRVQPRLRRHPPRGPGVRGSRRRARARGRCRRGRRAGGGCDVQQLDGREHGGAGRRAAGPDRRARRARGSRRRGRRGLVRRGPGRHSRRSRCRGRAGRGAELAPCRRSCRSNRRRAGVRAGRRLGRQPARHAGRGVRRAGCVGSSDRTRARSCTGGAAGAGRDGRARDRHRRSHRGTGPAHDPPTAVRDPGCGRAGERRTSPTRVRSNTPIFGDLRSNWLNDDEKVDSSWSDNEVDRGWTAAGRAEQRRRRRRGPHPHRAARTPPRRSPGPRWRQQRTYGRRP